MFLYFHAITMNDKLAKVTWYIIDKPEDANVFLSWINILTFDVHGHSMCVMFVLEGPNIKLLTTGYLRSKKVLLKNTYMEIGQTSRDKGYTGKKCSKYLIRQAKTVYTILFLTCRYLQQFVV